MRRVAVLRYITHPEVVVDPATPVAQWRLSDVGRARLDGLLAQPWVRSIERVVSSDETKAMEAAAVLADHLGLAVERRPATGEIDRTATGFLPPDEFELVADACFARPDVSARGWERAVDAQARITSALADVLADAADHDVAVVGHGGVGTLWYCGLARVPIGRRWDQAGQGHYLTVDGRTGEARHHWRPID